MNQSLLAKLSPNSRKYLYWAILAMVILFLGALIYSAKTQSASNRSTATAAVVTKKIDMLDYDDGVFEDSLFKRVNRDIDALHGEVDDLEKSFSRKVDSLERSLSKDIASMKELLNELKEKPSDAAPTNKASPIFTEQTNKQQFEVDPNIIQQQQAYAQMVSETALPPATENPSTNAASVAENTTASATAPSPSTPSQPKNSIEMFTVTTPTPPQDPSADITKLTPSFMKASLLTGVIASTGNNQPVPMLIRINDLAQLPNEIEENLKGCFVVAEGTAALDQERILVRTLRLSCVTHDGVAIIDEPIKGWVADQDSRPGLSAKPIAKFGTHLARSALAGFIGGLGSAINESSLVTREDNLGRDDTRFKDTEMDTLFRAGLGRGIENVTTNLEKFYMDLAKSTLPVLEVGPKQNITVLLNEGVELKIRARNEKTAKKGA